MKTLILGVVLLMAVILLTSPVFAQTLPEWLKSVPGKPAALFSEVPLYPGLTFTKPVLVKDIYEKKNYSYITTGRIKKLQPNDVLDYYDAILTKRGWKTLGPAGGSSSLLAIFKKEGREVKIYCYATPNGGTDEPIDPRGATIEITYR